MDEQLKQRLWGATIIVALAVIFVPMVFDEPGEDRAGISGDNVPPLPPEAQEREIALPAMPDEEKKSEPTTGEPQTRERPAYRIIPLDEPPPPPKADTKAPAEEAQDASAETELPTEFDGDEGGMPDELPMRDSPLAKLPRGGKPKDATPSRSEVAAPKPAVPRTAVPGPGEAPAAERAASPKAASPGKPPAAKQPLTMETRPPPAVRANPATSAPARKETPGEDAATKATKSDAKAQTEDSKPSVKPAGSSPAKPMARESAEVARPAKPDAARDSAQESPAAAPAKKKPDTVASTATTSSSKATSPSIAKAPESKPAQPAANKPKAAPTPSTWVVRAGTYNSEASAKALADKLKKQQFPAYVQKVTTERGTVFRVQVGPASEKARAEQTRKRLESSAGVQATLIAR